MEDPATPVTKHQNGSQHLRIAQSATKPLTGENPGLMPRFIIIYMGSGGMILALIFVKESAPIIEKRIVGELYAIMESDNQILADCARIDRPAGFPIAEPSNISVRPWDPFDAIYCEAISLFVCVKIRTC